MARLPPFVAVAGPDRWVVKHGFRVEPGLRRIGFSRWVPGLPFVATFRTPLPFAQMGVLAGRLRDLGVAFSAGRDWAPAEVIRFLRDEGHFEGGFLEIAWKESGRWGLREV